MPPRKENQGDAIATQLTLPTFPSASAVGQNLVTQPTNRVAPIVMPAPTQNVADFEDRNRYTVQTPYGTMSSSRAISQAGFDRNVSAGIQGLDRPERFTMNENGGFTRNQSGQEWQDANIARIYRNAPAMDQKRTNWVENTIKDRRANQEYYATPSGATITAPTNMFGQPIKSWQDTYAKSSAANLKRLGVDAGEGGVLRRDDVSSSGRVVGRTSAQQRPSTLAGTPFGGGLPRNGLVDSATSSGRFETLNSFNPSESFSGSMASNYAPPTTFGFGNRTRISGERIGSSPMSDGIMPAFDLGMSVVPSYMTNPQVFPQNNTIAMGLNPAGLRDNLIANNNTGNVYSNFLAQPNPSEINSF